MTQGAGLRISHLDPKFKFWRVPEGAKQERMAREGASIQNGERGRIKIKITIFYSVVQKKPRRVSRSVAGTAGS